MKRPHYSYEMEILMFHLLCLQAENKEAKKILGYLKEQTLPEATKSLLFSVSKKIKLNH